MASKIPLNTRLDRLLGRIAGISRAQAQKEIRTGMVQVNGVVLTNPAQHVKNDDRLTRNGQLLPQFGYRYFMLHKPVGVVCTSGDHHYRNAIDLLAAANPNGLHVAGRLDVDTTGLVLITDDGEWSHRLTSPRHKQPKVYRATLTEPLSRNARQQLESGIQLKGEPRPCQPAVVEVLGENIIQLTLVEGKYHQVKRMLAAVGNQVVDLHRESIGTILLDPALAPGQSRPLRPDEIAMTEG